MCGNMCLDQRIITCLRPLKLIRFLTKYYFMHRLMHGIMHVLCKLFVNDSLSLSLYCVHFLVFVFSHRLSSLNNFNLSNKCLILVMLQIFELSDGCSIDHGRADIQATPLPPASNIKSRFFIYF